MNVRIFFLISALAAVSVFAEDSERAANTIVLDETGVKNLGIETVVAAPTDFEESFFAIGRIEEIPQNHAVLSSRIAGRIAGLTAYEGDEVKKDDELVRVESRLAGDPPPIISLKSPISGLVFESHIRLGEPVEPDNELLDILDLSEVWAVARVPEDFAPKLEPGKTKAHIRVAALGDQVLDGTLLRFGTFADQKSGTVDAIFQVPNADLRMRPGMRAEFSVVTKVRSGVMSVPRIAIQGDPTKRVVYVKDFELPNAFVRVPVQLGDQNEEFVEVIKGIFPGDDVVTEGSYSLGFAGGGSGISLKEALDAAHGHEHAEDGSELTEDQKEAAKSDDHGHDHGEPAKWGGMNQALLIYSGVVTLLFLVVAQRLWNRRKSSTAA